MFIPCSFFLYVILSKAVNSSIAAATSQVGMQVLKGTLYNICKLSEQKDTRLAVTLYFYQSDKSCQKCWCRKIEIYYGDTTATNSTMVSETTIACEILQFS